MNEPNTSTATLAKLTAIVLSALPSEALVQMFGYPLLIMCGSVTGSLIALYETKLPPNRSMWSFIIVRVAISMTFSMTIALILNDKLGESMWWGLFAASSAVSWLGPKTVKATVLRVKGD